MANPVWLSGTNGFIPSATGQAIAFVRDPAKFKLNSYVQLIRAPKPVVAYAVLDPDQAVRVVNDANFDWPDGDPRPSGNNNLGNFVWNSVRVFRRDYPYTIGEQALEAAEGWNPKAFFNAQILTQAMTNATNRFNTMLDTVGNWGANTSDANSLNGGAGTWNNASNDPSSPNYLAIKKSLLSAIQNIVLATNGMISLSDMRLVISPGLASAIAETSEVHDYMRGQEKSLQVLMGKEPSVQDTWGVPSIYAGLEVIVEDSVIVKEYPSATGVAATVNRSFIKGNKTAWIVSRPGGVDGNYGSPSFSTVQRYYYKYELAIESFYEAKHKLHEAHVVDQFHEVLAAPRAGWLITNCM